MHASQKAMNVPKTLVDQTVAADSSMEEQGVSVFPALKEIPREKRVVLLKVLVILHLVGPILSVQHSMELQNAVAVPDSSKVPIRFVDVLNQSIPAIQILAATVQFVTVLKIHLATVQAHL
jgi:hypothetical protein